MKVHCGLERLSVEVFCSCFSGCGFSGVTWFGHLVGKRGWLPPGQATMQPPILTICPDCPRPGAPSGSSAYQYVPLSRQKASFLCSFLLLLFLNCKFINFPRRKGGLDYSQSQTLCFHRVGQRLFHFGFSYKSSMAQLTSPSLQSCNHAWPGAKAWGCCPKLLHR